MYGDKLKLGDTILEDKIAPKVDDIAFYDSDELVGKGYDYTTTVGATVYQIV